MHHYKYFIQVCNRLRCILPYWNTIVTVYEMMHLTLSRQLTGRKITTILSGLSLVALECFQYINQ